MPRINRSSNSGKVRNKSITRKQSKAREALAIIPVPPERPWELSPEEMVILKNSVAKGASDAELQYCLTVARHYKVDPWKRQIWFISRWDSGADNGKGGRGAHVWTPTVGIDGLLFIAARDHKNDFGSVSLPEFGPMHTPDGAKFSAPEWAKVKVWKKGETEPTESQAWWDEYAPSDLSKAPFWRKMPRRMIAKCATALAIRQAYPDLGGVFIPEECERMNEDYTPGGRQIVESVPHGSHEAAQEVARAKIAAHTSKKKIPDSEYHSEAVPAAQIPSTPIPDRQWRGTIEIDSTNEADPILRGDIADLMPFIEKHCTATWKNAWWHILPRDVETMFQMAEQLGYKIKHILPKPQPKGPASEPVIVSGTIQRCNAGMAGRYPVRQITLLLPDKTKPSYSCFDKNWFEALDSGLGKIAQLVVKENKGYWNILRALKIGSREWLEDGTPVVQRDRPAGSKTLWNE
jgi:hypothetical protein